MFSPRKEYFADMQVHVGSQVEVDIAALEELRSTAQDMCTTATTALAPAWAPLKTDLL